MISKKNQFCTLVSPGLNKELPIYRWHSFKHSYAKLLVEKLLTEFKLKEGSWVLDPFCGGGTTLLTCKEHNINSVGIDILPFSVFLSNVKIRDYDEERLLKYLKKLRTKPEKRIIKKDLPDIPIIQKAFKPEIRKELLILKEMIDSMRDHKTRDLFKLGLLSILESFSNTSKGGGFLRLVNRQVYARDIHETLLKKITSMIADVILFNNIIRDKKVFAQAQKGDARRLENNRKFDAIITSPPYPNRHDYTRIYSLELIFEFISSNEQLKKIRYETLRSHVEAREKFSTNGYVQPKLLTRLISQINKNGVNNPQVIDMIKGYFEDMYLCLREMSNCLNNRGKIGMVVSNVRFAGINIPVDKILSSIGEQVSLKPKAIWLARFRGNSSQQMRDYKRKPSRESIIVWEK